MPRPWENVKELYPGYIEEVYGPEKASDGTTREEFYDKMVANGWNKPGDDDLIVAMYLRTALHFEREDQTKPIDSLVFVELEKSNGSDPESRKQTIDRCRNLFTDSNNKELIKGAHLLELESKHLDFVVQMRKKGWTHEGDDKIIDMLYALPNSFLAGSITESFRENICLASSGNSVESRRSLLRKVVNYINYDIREYEKEEHSNTLEALEKELEKHDKLILLDEDDYKKASQKMPEAELAYKNAQITNKLEEFMVKGDVKGAADYILDVNKRYYKNYVEKVNDAELKRERDVIDDWIEDQFEMAKNDKIVEECQLFMYDLYGEVQRRTDEAKIKVCQLIEETENNIKENPPKDAELLVDNPKVVNAMAKEYILKHSNHDIAIEFNSNVGIANQMFHGNVINENLDLSKRPVDLTGVDYVPTHEHKAFKNRPHFDEYKTKIAHDVIMSHNELDDEKKQKYLKEKLLLQDYAKDRYNISLGKSKEGKPQITSLPNDIKNIKAMKTHKLYEYREKLQGLIAANEKCRERAIAIGVEFDKLDNELNSLVNENHPAYNKCKPVIKLVRSLKNADQGSSIHSIIESLNDLKDAAKAYKENYGGDILNDGGKRSDLVTKIYNAAERAYAGFAGISDQAEGKSFIDRDISNHKETIRRIDKQLELKNAHPAPNKKIGFVPNPSKQVEDILEAVNNAEAAVWRSSTEYKSANRSLIELDRALKKYKNVPPLFKALQANHLETIRDIIQRTRANVNSYFTRKKRQGLMNGGADLKTQRRIDIMRETEKILDACDEFIDDRTALLSYDEPEYVRESFEQKHNNIPPVNENNVQPEDDDYVPPVFENKEAMHFIYGDLDEDDAEQIAQEQAPNEDRQEKFEKLDIAPEHRETISEKADRSRLDNFVEKQEQARKEAAEKALKEQQEREERAKNPVDIDKELKSAQDAISKLKNEGEDINSPEYDKHLSTIVTCIKILKYRKNANAFETMTGEEFDNIDQSSTAQNPTFEKMLKQTKREDLIEQATYDKGQNLFSNYSHTSDQIKEEKRKLKEENKKLEEEKKKLEEESGKLMDKAAALGDAVEPQSFFRRKMK